MSNSILDASLVRWNMRENTGSKELAERIKELRRGTNLTQQNLADKAGIAISTLQKIETAKVYGERDTHQRIADALGVNVQFLLFGKEKAEPAPKPKSRIPDLPPDDPPLTPEEIAALNDPRLGGVFYSKEGLSRLSNRMLRQVALDALSLLKEIEDREQNEQ
jgi:transcriptional regulator with XRE-family HTH domain